MEISTFPILSQEDSFYLPNFFSFSQEDFGAPPSMKKLKTGEEDLGHSFERSSSFQEVLNKLFPTENEEIAISEPVQDFVTKLFAVESEEVWISEPVQESGEFGISEPVQECEEIGISEPLQNYLEFDTSVNKNKAFQFSNEKELSFGSVGLKRSRSESSEDLTANAALSSNGQRRCWMKNRSQAWWEQIGSLDCPEEEFKKAFKMSKSTFEMICRELEPVVNKKNTLLRQAIPARQRVAVCIWRLATGEPLREVSKRFGLGISTCHKLILEVCKAIQDVLKPKFLQWPKGSKIQENREEFEKISGISNVGGALYTTHIPIISPKGKVELYFNKRHTERNKKASYSVSVQGVMNHKGIFTDVSIGWPGSMSDEQVLEKSSLFQRGNMGLMKDKVLVGNSGHPLMDWVSVPYTHQHLTWTQHAFNDKISEVQKIARQRVAVCIWRLATGESLREVSRRFGLGISTCHKIVVDVCKAIQDVLKPKYLQWPNGSKVQENREEFRKISGINNVGGALYTIHVPIIAPKGKVELYFNKRHTERNNKASYSVSVQAVVDHKGIFTDVSIGWPGSISDEKILEKTSLFQRGNMGLMKDGILVGNSGHPLMDWLLVPYSHPHLTWTQHAFNEKISEVQKIAQDGFMRMKTRWACLQKRTETNLQDLPVVLMACCVLHNICEINNEGLSPELKFEMFDDEMVAENVVRSVNASHRRDQVAKKLLHFSP